MSLHYCIRFDHHVYLIRAATVWRSVIGHHPHAQRDASMIWVSLAHIRALRSASPPIPFTFVRETVPVHCPQADVRKGRIHSIIATLLADPTLSASVLKDMLFGVGGLVGQLADTDEQWETLLRLPLVLDALLAVSDREKQECEKETA
jgi:hypothetical protein